VQDVKERQNIVQGRAYYMDEEQGGGIRIEQNKVSRDDDSAGHSQKRGMFALLLRLCSLTSY